MDVVVRGKHFQVPDRVELHARAKLQKLGRHLPALDGAVAELDLSHEKARQPDRRYVAHVTVSGRGLHLQAEEHAAQPEAAVDQAVQVLTRQAERHKERLTARRRRTTTKAGRTADQTLTAPASDRVTKVKRFAVKPMTSMEALKEMDTLGHEFFIFQDEQQGGFAVLYRRRDGEYGIIIPELT